LECAAQRISQLKSEAESDDQQATSGARRRLSDAAGDRIRGLFQLPVSVRPTVRAWPTCNIALTFHRAVRGRVLDLLYTSGRIAFSHHFLPRRARLDLRPCVHSSVAAVNRCTGDKCMGRRRGR